MDSKTLSITAWLRDTKEGRDVLAKAAARLCKDCPRIQHLQEKCKTCQHRKTPKVTSEILDRLPPHNLDAEQALIGSVLLKPEVYQKIKPALEPGDFYSAAHEAIWKRMRELLDRGEALDVTLLVERLKQAGEWEDVGGAAYLAEIVHAVAVSLHAPDYAAIVREKAGLRRLVWTLCETLTACYEPGASFKGGPLVDLLKHLGGKLKNYREK